MICQREVLASIAQLLNSLEERSGEEVARRLNISVQAMKSRLHRARAMVRESLDAALGNKA